MVFVRSVILRVSPVLGSSFYVRRARRNITVAFFVGLITTGLVLSCLSFGDKATACSDVPTDNDTISTHAKVTGRRPSVRPGFTILTPSYKRESLLPAFLSTYASGNIPSLTSVIIQWVDQDSAPSDGFAQSLAKYPVPVYIVRTVDRSLNDRFRWPIPSSKVIASNVHEQGRSSLSDADVVLSIDDDLTFNVVDIEAGYQVFHEYASLGNPRMVGYFARDIESGLYHYPARPTYNIVLTKGAFLLTEWLTAYWADDLAQVRDYVTPGQPGRNCEDILMSYVVANKTGHPPLFYEAVGVDAGDRKENHGISINHPNLLSHRTTCVQLFEKHYGGSPLVSTSVQIRRRLQPLTAHH
ncbi:glycosyl transferase family 64 domain-domain-containing protein [Kockovaella imperatae]|uniref:Glycosyl transferase family 64 domain-domain-containing protein n=1 Tax=Kockovaella imperatae TaxID=4999 RepID=A0A1Y1U8F6_9TREE|nr:glycosyl transferase family 64 domain-domain-containing protein [Kockovaella imperatae]ORX34321.1 glycosyl transferase family 64 domain-domain-containing protein [Kockovaella imperatae]